MPSVTLRVISDDPSPVQIEGVAIEIYDATTAIFQTSGITDNSGQLVISLPNGSYDVIFYKIGITILPKQPQRIVVDSTLSNVFQISGHIRSTPESINPILCTISGFIVGVDGKQAKNRLIFEPVKTITVLSHLVISPSFRKEIASSEDGYFEFELLRNTKYTGYFVFPQGLFGVDPGKLDIITPNSPSVGIDNLLFPIPIKMTFSSSSINLSVSGLVDESITASMSFSDGSARDAVSTAWAGVRVTNSNGDVVEASLDASKLRLRPKSPGTAVISTTREINDRAFFDPLQDYITDTVVVTVS